MILPTKRIGHERALLYVGSEILGLLSEPKTVSRIWEEVKVARAAKGASAVLTYDWFVLALDLLFTIRAVEYDRGQVRKAVS